MKKRLASFFLFFIGSVQAMLGQNLVRNPSFEDYDTCPDFSAQIHYASGWHGFSSEFYNSCDTTYYGVPINFSGYQNAVSGNAYAGLATHLAGNNYREFIQIQLTNPLIAGEKYYASMKASLADSSFCTSNNLGILFSSTVFDDSNVAPIYNYAQAYSPLIINDAQDWTTVSGSFIADSAYQYVSIGNFFDTIYTIQTCTTSFSYYYVDDVCVSTDSLSCGWASAITLTISSTNVTCFGDSDGSANIIATGGVTPYYYLWSNGDTTATLYNLSAGIYTVTVTDSSGNTISDTAAVTRPDKLIVTTASVTHVTCYGDNDGAAKVIAEGGIPPYSFLWSDGQTTDLPTGFFAGTYTVTVTDSTGCIANTSITIQDGLQVETGDISGPDLSIIRQISTYSVLLEDSNYSYNWTITNGAIISGQGSSTIEVLWDSASSGYIQLIAEEQQGCSDTTFKTVTLTNPTGIANMINATVTLENPVSDFLRLTLPIHSLELSVYDIMGKKMYSSFIYGKEIVIDISEFPARGIYFLTLKAKEVFLVKKFSIQK